jgi:hypothetical protein
MGDLNVPDACFKGNSWKQRSFFDVSGPWPCVKAMGPMLTFASDLGQALEQMSKSQGPLASQCFQWNFRI